MRASKGVTRFKSSAADGRKRYADWAGLVGSGLLGGGCGAEKKLAKRVNGSLGDGDFARGVRRVLAAWDLARPLLFSAPPREIAGAPRQCTHRWVTVHGNVWGGSATNGR